MSTRSARLVAGLFALATACAGRRLPAPPPAPNVSRATFAPGLADAVFERTLRAVQRAGYDVEGCDARRSALQTERIEVDAACGATTCLARQRIVLKVGHRAAKLSVTRENWDPGVRAWVEADPRDVEAEVATLGAELDAASAGTPVKIPKFPRADICKPSRTRVASGTSGAAPASRR